MTFFLCHDHIYVILNSTGVQRFICFVIELYYYIWALQILFVMPWIILKAHFSKQKKKEGQWGLE